MMTESRYKDLFANLKKVLLDDFKKEISQNCSEISNCGDLMLEDFNFKGTQYIFWKVTIGDVDIIFEDDVTGSLSFISISLAYDLVNNQIVISEIDIGDIAGDLAKRINDDEELENKMKSWLQDVFKKAL